MDLSANPSLGTEILPTPLPTCFDWEDDAILCGWGGCELVLIGLFLEFPFGLSISGQCALPMHHSVKLITHTSTPVN